MEMMTTIKNPISCGELFLGGVKEDEKVMENKSTICVDRLAAGIILCSPQEQCDQMPYSPEEQCDAERILPSDNSFHSLPPTTEISHRMRTRKNNNTQNNAVHDVSPGFWLSTVSEERYEVRENKSTKKRARGLKAMKGVGSDLA